MNHSDHPNVDADLLMGIGDADCDRPARLIPNGAPSPKTLSWEEADHGDWGHIPVLRDEVIAALALKPGGAYLDATLGAGGHSAAILAAVPQTQLVALDCDDRALTIAETRLAPWRDRVELVRTNFADYDPGDRRFDGILADLGVSSMQFDTADRGFSFRHSAPLDMRMDQRQGLTAAEVVNTWDERALADAIYLYGEERRSRSIARRIVADRPFQTTTDLAEAIARCVPKKYRYGRIHPATRTFQALRIIVNQEIQSLETFLDQAPTWLKPGGRIALISFHSLEDRPIKHRLRESPLVQVLTKKPIIPTETECEGNPRSRSAKLRIAARLGD